MRDTRFENAQPLNIKGEVEDEGVMCACVGVHDRRFRIQSERNYTPRAKPKNE